MESAGLGARASSRGASDERKTPQAQHLNRLPDVVLVFGRRVVRQFVDEAFFFALDPPCHGLARRVGGNPDEAEPAIKLLRVGRWPPPVRAWRLGISRRVVEAD